MNLNKLLRKNKYQRWLCRRIERSHLKKKKDKINPHDQPRCNHCDRQYIKDNLKWPGYCSGECSASHVLGPEPPAPIPEEESLIREVEERKRDRGAQREQRYRLIQQNEKRKQDMISGDPQGEFPRLQAGWHFA